MTAIADTIRSRAFVAAACAVLLSGCVVNHGSFADRVVDRNAAIARAKATILYHLKDPESARFRAARVAANGNVCVEVNAKNSYGGYTGFQLYFYDYGHDMLLGEYGATSGTLCNQASVMPRPRAVAF